MMNFSLTVHHKTVLVVNSVVVGNVSENTENENQLMAQDLYLYQQCHVYMRVLMVQVQVRVLSSRV